MSSTPPILGFPDLHNLFPTASGKYRNTMCAPATPLEAIHARGWPRKSFRSNTYTNTGGGEQGVSQLQTKCLRI
jgi:hypothetical protein